LIFSQVLYQLSYLGDPVPHGTPDILAYFPGVSTAGLQPRRESLTLVYPSMRTCGWLTPFRRICQGPLARVV
jgi:hypothetical protein